MTIQIGAKVWREGAGGPWRVVGHGTWEGEKSVIICRPAYWAGWRDAQKIDRAAPPPANTETVPVANLAKHRGGWKERWVQTDLEEQIAEMANES